MFERARDVSNVPAIVEVIRQMVELGKRNDRASRACLGLLAESLCANLEQMTGSRYRIPKAIDDGMAISTIVQHKPKPPHPPTTRPREFDTLFFAALILMEVAGLRVTFQWRKDPASPRTQERGRYYLRGKLLSGAAGMRMYVTRTILNAEPGHRTQFNEDHHSYRLRDLIQRNGGGLLPDGKLGRQAAIDRCSENYAANHTEHHAELPPDEYRKLLTDLLAVATIFHGEVSAQ
jgi:hypothetical protein